MTRVVTTVILCMVLASPAFGSKSLAMSKAVEFFRGLTPIQLEAINSYYRIEKKVAKIRELTEDQLNTIRDFNDLQWLMISWHAPSSFEEIRNASDEQFELLNALSDEEIEFYGNGEFTPTVLARIKGKSTGSSTVPGLDLIGSLTDEQIKMASGLSYMHIQLIRLINTKY